MNNGPLILLDFDGVINTLGGTPPWDDMEGDIPDTQMPGQTPPVASAPATPPSV